MRTIETKVFTFDEHTNKAACIEWVKENWHDLGEHCLYEAIDSLKAFAKYFGKNVDYKVSITPDRGGYITYSYSDSDAITTMGAVFESGLLNKDFLSGNCPLTGVCYDETLLDAVRSAKTTDLLIDVLNEAANTLIGALHREGEYIYSDEGISEMLEINEYEFTEFGTFI